MILGDRCTRACGFCLVDTRKPLPLDPDEPAPGRRRGRHARARARGDHERRPRRPRRRWCRRVRGHHRGGPRASARDTQVEVLIPDCKGVGRRARRDLRRPARRAEPQPRDGGPPPACGAAVGRVRPLARAAGAVPRMPVCSRNRASSWAWVRPPTRCAARSPTCATWASTCSPSASTCGRRASTCRWPGGGRPTSSPSSARTPRASASRHVESGPLVRSSYHAKRATAAPLRPVSVRG